MKRDHYLQSILLIGSALIVCFITSVSAEETEVIERSIVAKDGHFFPEIIEVPTNKKIRLIIKNEGPGPEEFESSRLGVESVMNAGVTRKVIIAPLKPGEYPFIGEFHVETAKGKIIAK